MAVGRYKNGRLKKGYRARKGGGVIKVKKRKTRRRR